MRDVERGVNQLLVYEFFLPRAIHQERHPPSQLKFEASRLRIALESILHDEVVLSIFFYSRRVSR